MEIIIRTDGTETVVHATEPGAAAAAATDVPAELAARAAAIGATNAGAAPTAPGTTGAPPVNITAASPDQLAPGDAAGESAGAAPRDL